ncbi:hypothetical protein NBRC116588_27950 [Pyruvatibacter sp. HU-CL02332]
MLINSFLSVRERLAGAAEVGGGSGQAPTAVRIEQLLHLGDMQAAIGGEMRTAISVMRLA